MSVSVGWKIAGTGFLVFVAMISVVTLIEPSAHQTPEYRAAHEEARQRLQEAEIDDRRNQIQEQFEKQRAGAIIDKDAKACYRVVIPHFTRSLGRSSVSSDMVIPYGPPLDCCTVLSELAPMARAAVNCPEESGKK